MAKFDAGDWGTLGEAVNEVRRDDANEVRGDNDSDVRGDDLDLTDPVVVGLDTLSGGLFPVLSSALGSTSSTCSLLLSLLSTVGRQPYRSWCLKSPSVLRTTRPQGQATSPA